MRGPRCASMGDADHAVCDRPALELESGPAASSRRHRASSSCAQNVLPHLVPHSNTRARIHSPEAKRTLCRGCHDERELSEDDVTCRIAVDEVRSSCCLSESTYSSARCSGKTI